MTQAFRPRMSLVFVTQVFHPDQQATSQLLSRLVAALAQRGQPCVVLAGYPMKRADQRFLRLNETWNGVQIVRGGLKLNGKASLPARALAYASYSLWALWTLIAYVPASAHVVAVTNPPFAPILTWLGSRLRGWTYSVLLHDIYPDGLVSLGGLSTESWTTRLWRSLNRRAFNHAERLYVLGRDMGALAQERYGVPSEKVAYFPNWSPAEPGERVVADSTHLWRELSLAGKFVVQYSGNMGLWHDMDAIVQAAALLRDRPGIVFLFIGEGRRKKAAEQLAAELGITSIRWLPFRSSEDLPDSLACCQAALISQRAGLEGVAVPSKLYGILASGRAVLAQVPAGSETAMVVREEECGLVIQPGDAQGLADAIKRLAQNHTETMAMGARAFAAYQAKYTLAAAVARFEHVMNSSSEP